MLDEISEESGKLQEQKMKQLEQLQGESWEGAQTSRQNNPPPPPNSPTSGKGSWTVAKEWSESHTR